jgi:hypothetical protein
MSVSNKESHQETDGVGSSVEPASQLSNAGSARRRFAKRAGLGSTGVLLTLASQTGIAGAMCKSPSRQTSALAGGSAHPNDATVACNGLTPSEWTGTGTWPCSKDYTKFGSIFPCPGTTYADMFLKNVVGSTGTDQLSMFGRALTATYLNVLSNRIGFLTAEDVVSMFQQINSNGQYLYSPGKYWDITGLTNYLVSTYTRY